ARIEAIEVGPTALGGGVDVPRVGDRRTPVEIADVQVLDLVDVGRLEGSLDPRLGGVDEAQRPLLGVVGRQGQHVGGGRAAPVVHAPQLLGAGVGDLRRGVGDL